MTLISLIAAIAQVVLGGVVRVTGSGDACPDWPLCHGKIIPPLDYHIWLEFTHRLAATAVGLLVVVSLVLAWRHLRISKPVIIATSASMVLVVAAAILGGLTVLSDLSWWTRLIHLGLAELTVAGLAIAWLAGHPGDRPDGTQSPANNVSRQDRVVAWAGLSGLLLVVLYGSYMVGIGYGASCHGWPLCLGSRNPAGNAFLINMIHRYMVAIVAVLVLRACIAAWKTGSGAGPTAPDGGVDSRFPDHRDRSGCVYGMAGLVPGGCLSSSDVCHSHLGVNGVDGRGPLGSRNFPGTDPTRGAHRLTRPSSSAAPRVLRDYVALTKPRIISLLLITAVGSMFLAAQGWPDPLTTAFVVICGYLAAGGTNALNQGAESDIDKRMRRTHRRPVASGRVSKWQTYIFGIVLNLAAFVVLAVQVNLLSAALAVSGTLIYVFVYTKGLQALVFGQSCLVGPVMSPFSLGWRLDQVSG
ncbi:MAG: COX15/CtaA family protein [Actinomycetia bacterium]|nr:COX15/CtaA family protein [Actinomycetes bacterium]